MGAGNVLIPSDTAGRTLELALLLEQHWQRLRLPFTVALLTPVAYSTLEFAKSQLEWMNQDISDAFSRSRTIPFEFRSESAPARLGGSVPDPSSWVVCCSCTCVHLQHPLLCLGKGDSS